MSKNTFNLSNEALTIFKGGKKPQIIKAIPPEEEPLDEFDQFDEMFLRLNNALIERHDQLVELQKTLKEKEGELIQREIDIDNDESINLRDKKELKERKEAIKKEAEDLKSLKGSRDAVKGSLQAKIKELEDKIEKFPEIPIVFTQIPSAIKNNTLPFMNRVRDFDKTLYQNYLRYFEPIEVALRHIHEIATIKHDDRICMKIAAVFYSTQFDASTPEDIYWSAKTLINEIKDIKHDGLQKAVKAFEENILCKLEALAKT